MSITLKIIFYVVSGLVGLFVLIAVAALFFVDANVYKPRLETATSEALGMEVGVDGRLKLGFSPGLHVTLEDAHIRNRGADLVSAKQARLGVDFFSLLQKEIRIERVALKRPVISIERDRDGTFNFEKPGAGGKTLPALNLANVSLSDATLRYVDKQSGEEYSAEDCRVDVRRLRYSAGTDSTIMKNISFTTELSCGEIQKNHFAVSDLKFSAEARNGVFNLDPVKMRVLDAHGSGSLLADFSGAVPLYQVRYALTRLHVEEFLKFASSKKIAEGAMNFSANLTLRGVTVEAMKQTADGEISLRGENLTFHGSDLDKTIARFESSQNFSLVDAGAFFFVGPMGLAATKGYDFASIFRGSEGHSEIRMIVSDWKIQQGMAQAKDVAMATSRNRIALTGRIDFVNEKFDDITMALIDPKGCATVRQKIRGPFRKPVAEKPSVIRSLAGPALKLLKKGKELFLGGECEVFYAGSVAAPEG